MNACLMGWWRKCSDFVQNSRGVSERWLVCHFVVGILITVSLRSTANIIVDESLIEHIPRDEEQGRKWKRLIAL